MDRREFLKRSLASGATLAMPGPDRVLRAGEMRSVALDAIVANRKLAGHRIATIESHTLVHRFPRAIGPSARGSPVGRHGHSYIRIVTTDQGVMGWCLGGGQPVDPQPLIGAPVSDLFDVTRGIADDVPEWLDKTLHDLAARINGVPVWRLIGARGRRDVLLYSGAIYMDDVLPEDRPRGISAVLAACAQDHAAGYRAFKLKIGRGHRWMPREAGLQRDIAVTHAVREAFPDCRLLVDANDAYSVEEASSYLAATADCDLYWVEEAFVENSNDYRRLKEAMDRAGSKALIAEGESSHGQGAATPTRFGHYSTAFMERLFRLAEEQLVDVFLMDLDAVGFSRWRRVMPEIVQAGVTASPHTWIWPMRTFQAAQLAGGTGGIDIVEGIPAQTLGVDSSAYHMRDGRLLLPNAPGFGLELQTSQPATAAPE